MSLSLKARNTIEAQYCKTYFTISETENGSTALRDIRIRMYMRHTFMLSSLYPNNCLIVYKESQSQYGLYGNYNDWRIPGRPASAGAKGTQFDSEVILRFNTNQYITKSFNMQENQAWLRGVISQPYHLDGELFYERNHIESSFSYINMNETYHNPKNLLMEKFVRSVDVTELTTIKTNSRGVSTVKATTSSPHGFHDGMCVTITGLSTPDGKTDTSTHMFGHEPGQRYMGDFAITVLSDTEFTYTTSHHRNGEHPAIKSENPNMKAEIWELCEYTDSFTSISSDENIITIHLPYISGQVYDFNVGDYVSVSGTIGYNAHNMTIQSIDKNNNILYVTKPASIVSTDTETSGKLIYTPRLPSLDVPVNYKTPTITSCPVVHHAKRNLLLMADVDSYADNSSNCYDAEKNLVTKYLSSYPVIHFNIPTIRLKDDENVHCEFGIFANGLNPNSNPITFGVGTLKNYELTKTSIASDILPHIDITEPSIATNTFENYVTSYLYSFFMFNIDGSYAKEMLSGDRSHSLYIAIRQISAPQTQLLFNSSECDENIPYFIINFDSDVIYGPNISIDDTYMYYICNEISYDGSDYKVTVPGINNRDSEVYVRSGNFFNVGDEIEVMHTLHFNTESASITRVDYDSDNDVYTITFKYNSGTPTEEVLSETYCIIQNKSNIISSYSIDSNFISDANDILTTPKIDGLHKKLYNNGTEFDINHAATMETLTMQVITEPGDYSHYLSPIIMRDVDIDSGRFSCISDRSVIDINGINFDKISGIPYAVVGSHYLLNGYIGHERQFQLTKTDDNRLEFIYGTSYGHCQLSVNVIGSRNTTDGITQFKVSSECELNTGDSVYVISTPEYAIANNDNAKLPSSTVAEFLYGKEYFITVTDDDENNCKWITLYSKFINKMGTTPVSKDNYIYISDKNVELINTICENEQIPFVFRNGFTTLTIYDDYINTLSYKNRLFLAIDEYPPILYSESNVYEVGDYFYIYASDRMEFDIDDSSYVSVQYLLEDGDDRVKKYTFKSTTTGQKTYQFRDKCGNVSSITITIIDNPLLIELYNVKYLPDGTPVLTYKVTGEKGSLCNEEASDIGEPGFYAAGSNGKFGRITEISKINEGDKFDNFYFDITIDDIGDGDVIIYATLLEHATKPVTEKWYLPVVFSYTLTCHHAGDLITLEGINLDGRSIDGKSYQLAVNDNSWFELTDKYAGDYSKLEIKLSDTYIERHDFWPILLLSETGETISDNKFPVTIEITQKPTISMRNPTTFIHVKEKWIEPDDITAVDYYGNSILDSLTISGKVDEKTEGVYKLKYYAIDSCGQETDEIVRTVYVTAGCSIFIKADSDSYKLGDDITFVIDDSVTGTDGGKFNQNYLNNLVTLTDIDGNKIEGTIIKAGIDRKSITIQSPGIVGSIVRAQVDTGYDNDGYSECYITNICEFSILPKDESDVPLGTNMNGNTVDYYDSKFKNRNFSPVYTKDLSYSTFSIVTDENSLVQNVYTILLTNLGERLYNDEFGSGLEKRVFDIISDINGEGKILSECVNLIRKYENRVSVSIENSYVKFDADANQIDINLYIKVPRGNAKRISLTFRKDV